MRGIIDVPLSKAKSGPLVRRMGKTVGHLHDLKAPHLVLFFLND